MILILILILSYPMQLYSLRRRRGSRESLPPKPRLAKALVKESAAAGRCWLRSVARDGWTSHCRGCIHLWKRCAPFLGQVQLRQLIISCNLYNTVGTPAIYFYCFYTCPHLFDSGCLYISMCITFVCCYLTCQFILSDGLWPFSARFALSFDITSL